MGIKKRLGIMAMAAVTVSSAMAQQPVDYVNPIIDRKSTRLNSSHIL